MKFIEDTCKPAITGEQSYHIGYWRRYALLIFLSLDARRGARVFAELDGVMELFNTVDALFKHIDPELYEEYALVTPDQKRVCGKSFLMSVLNRGGSDPHIDSEDRTDGCCCVVPVGTDWSGGELAFCDLQLAVRCEPGDVVFFRSATLYHENLDYEGDRRSIVLTTDANSFTASGQLMDPDMIEEQHRYNTANNLTEKNKLNWMMNPSTEWFDTPEKLKNYLRNRLEHRIAQRATKKKHKYIIATKRPDWEPQQFTPRDPSKRVKGKRNRCHRYQ